MQQWLQTKLADDKKMDELVQRIDKALKDSKREIALDIECINIATRKKEQEWLEEHYQKPFFKPYVEYIKKEKRHFGQEYRDRWIKVIESFLARKEQHG